jgi:lactate dehydrogenase-like 2-hydroxyacid dehydrogenase
VTVDGRGHGGEKPAVLLGARMPDAFARELADCYEVLGPLAAPFPESVAALSPADAQRVRALVTMGTVDTSRAALARLPALGLVCCIGSGYEGVDLAAARERGLAVTHSPGANASAVADLAMGLLIASIRQMPEANAFLRRGDWKGNFARRMSIVSGLEGRRVGIYGLGAIGEKIARRAVAFEMEVGYHNRSPRVDVDYPYYPTLHDLAAWADVLVVAVRADAGNRHAVNAGVLAALGPNGHVVNIARGAVIDEAALVRALTEGVIAGAGLDVFEHEPEVPAELLELPNVALTPHIAGGTVQAQAAMQRMVVANLDAFFAGLPLPTPVPEFAAPRRVTRPVSAA